MLELTMILKIKRENISNAFKGTKLSIVQSRPSVNYAKDRQTWNLSKIYTAGFSGQKFYTVNFT